MSRTSPRQRKRTNTTFQSTRAKRQCLPERPADDVGSGSGDDGEVFDDTPLTRADIPTIVEAVMSQFPKESANDSEQEDEGSDDDNRHLGKYILKGAAPFASHACATQGKKWVNIK